MIESSCQAASHADKTHSAGRSGGPGRSSAETPSDAGTQGAPISWNLEFEPQTTCPDSERRLTPPTGGDSGNGELNAIRTSRSPRRSASGSTLTPGM